MISREEAKGILSNIAQNAANILAVMPKSAEEKVRALMNDIEALDMAIEALSQPERPKGRWEVIGKTKSGANILQCSNCKRIRRGSVKSAFCRDCGADMRGVEE